MSRTKPKAAPKLGKVKLPPPERMPRRVNKYLVVLSDEEAAAVQEVAEQREEPVTTTIRVLAVAAAESVLRRG